MTNALRVWTESELVMKVKEPLFVPQIGAHESDLQPPGSCLVGFLHPANNPELVGKFRERGLTAISMDCIPRGENTRHMDALASMSMIAGYKGVVLAADNLSRMMSGCDTPVGALEGATVVVVGYGVVGRQAARTAAGLGADVVVVDLREEAVRIAEDAGARGVRVQGDDNEAVRSAISGQLGEADVVVLSALVFGEHAPILMTGEMVEQMRPDSVVVDVSVDQGGNCEIVRPGEIYAHKGVTIIGILNLPGRLPVHSTQLYARNIANFLLHLTRGGKLNMEDPVVRAATVTHGGAALHEGSLKAVRAAGLA